ncbi:unnamed protein product [Schistosoma margrebowiei]|uniref:Uncharacterized protein n=1 Tax=Schistosoma margrebowiei TaxID=48269 RepID=A0A183N756_9TREM|nr:unnamed protein product [Schistosoma margrebowiei]
MVAGDQRLVRTPFVHSGSCSPCVPFVWNQGFPTRLGGSSISTYPVKAKGIRSEECNCDNVMDDSLIDNKLEILRDNQSLYLDDSFKHKYNSNDGHVVNVHNRINCGTTVKRHRISSVQDSEKEMKYSCIQCDRKFSSKFRLIEHKKVIHDGEL